MEIKKHNLGRYVVPNDTKNGVCLEIGANVGSFTEKYSSHFKLIHYYEPISECFNIVQEKLKSKNHIVGFNLAGYNSSNEYLKLVLHKSRKSGSTALKTNILNEEWSNEILEKVKTISLDDMIKNMGVNEIDYCKSDCETSEYYIFLNMNLSNIRYIGIEIHHQLGKNRWEELINYLLKTHECVSNDTNYQEGKNKEFLFKRR